jgi:V-type H+-transporting ATPase 16kDa proteolipid subunit
MGCMFAVVFTCMGAAYGTAKSGVSVCVTGVTRPDLIVKSVYSFFATLWCDDVRYG